MERTNMEKLEIRDITVDYAARMCDGSHIGGDILLFDEIGKMPMPAEPRRMKDLFLAICLQGSARYFVDSVEHTVMPGDLIIINPGRVAYDCTMSHDCRGIGMMISYDFFKETIKSVRELSALFLFARNHPVFRLPQNRADFIRDTFFRIKAKIDEEDNHFRRETVQTLFLAMVYEMCNVIYSVQSQNDELHTRAEEIFTQFLLLVEKHFRTERRVGWYSEQLCISPKYLSETVKAVSKRTPNEWIDSYVTMELRMLFRNTQKSIKEIARELNFSNQSFLGKYFKEHVGQSPSAYRKS